MGKNCPDRRTGTYSVPVPTCRCNRKTPTAGTAGKRLPPGRSPHQAVHLTGQRRCDVGEAGAEELPGETPLLSISPTLT